MMTEWQKRSKEFLDETIPATQNQAQEWTNLAEQNYRRSVELLKKAVKADADPSFKAGSERVRKLWEESLAVVKETRHGDGADQHQAHGPLGGCAAKKNESGSSGSPGNESGRSGSPGKVAVASAARPLVPHKAEVQIPKAKRPRDGKRG